MKWRLGVTHLPAVWLSDQEYYKPIFSDQFCLDKCKLWAPTFIYTSTSYIGISCRTLSDIEVFHDIVIRN